MKQLEDLLLEVSIDLIEIVLLQVQQIHVTQGLHREYPLGFFLLIGGCEIYISEVLAFKALSKDEISVGSLLDVGAFSLLNEINAVN